MKKTLLIFITIIISISIKTKAEDFSAIFNGDTIYYNITSSISPRKVEVTYKGTIFNSYTGSVTIPDSVLYNGDFYKITSIGNDAFINCNGLTSIYIPISVTSIGNRTFLGCSSLTSINIPDSVTFIGNEAFSGCYSLSSIIIPNSVTSIGYKTFSMCTGLTSITIPNSVTTIGYYAFERCYSLASINIPNFVTYIGKGTFSECYGLTSINIPNSVISIGDDAFMICDGLTSLTIPNSVTSIGNNAFYGCNSLTSITVDAINPPTIQNFTFYTVNHSIPVYVPCNSIPSYQSAQYWNSFTNFIGRLNVQHIDTSICSGNSINYFGTNLNTSGVYNFVNGCDSIIITLTVIQTDTTNFSAEICQGETYTHNGFNVSTSGLYTQTLQRANGCDSIVNLTLTVNPAYNDTIFAEICQGETYTLNGFNVNTAGLFTQSLQTYKGCDSIVNLALTVNQPQTTNITAEICQGETYSLNGFNDSTAGLHTLNLQTYKGCDSIINLTLTVNQPQTTNLTAEICQGETYTLNGFNVSTAGLHTLNLQTYKGCDSTVNLTLTVNQPQTINLTAEICQGETYTLNGFNDSTAGLHTLNLQTYKGCDSIVNLTLTVNQLQTTNINAEICQGETYTLNGFNVNTAGLYTQTLQTYKGCDSIVNLTLTVNQPQTTNINAEICQGETYTLNGFNVNTAGLFTQTLQTYKGCDSTVNLTLSVNQPATTNLTAQICQGETYTLNGFNVNTAGLHTLNLQTTKGCDSIVNLTLTVNQPAITNLTAEICEGETYTLNGFNDSTAGLHTLNLQTYKGCDSIVNLTLTVNQTQITNINAEICQGETYTLNGFNVNTAGLYTQTLQTYKGCDSIVNLTLTVNQPQTTNINAEICQGETYTLNGFNVNTAGLYTQTLQTYKGCDSTVNLTLLVNQPATTNLTAQICQGETYTLNGFNVNTAGSHTLNLQTTKGCDSIVNLTLTVNQPAITNLTAEICEGETYSLNGFNDSTDGIHTLNLYTVKGCDSTVNLTLTVNYPVFTYISAEICQGETYTLNGFNDSTAGLHILNLQTTKGCDSLINLTLTVNQPAITNLNAEICQGETYSLYGFNDSIAGLYTQNLQTTKGCDSTVNLTLNVNLPVTTNITAEICQGETYSLNGFNDSTAGIHTLNLQTYKGCDSTVNLTLSVNQSAITNISAEICQGETYTLNGFNVNTAGLYTQNLQTYKGCDSTVNLTLKVNPTSFNTYNDISCHGKHYENYGFNFTADTSGIYTQNLQTVNGCDSIIELNLTVYTSPIIPENLEIQVISNYIVLTWQGIESSYVIYRNDHLLTTTTAQFYIDNNIINGQTYCYKITSSNDNCESEYSDTICALFHNLDDISLNSISTKLYPNPTNGISKLKIEGLNTDADVLVYDMFGRIVKAYKIYKDTKELDIDLSGNAKGVYSIRILNPWINKTEKLVFQ